MSAWKVTFKDGASRETVTITALEAIVTDTGDLVLGNRMPFNYTVAAFAQGTWEHILPVTEPYAPKQELDN